MHEVRIPKLGTQIEDAEITEWVAAEGEKVTERQVLVVLETEKSSYDLESEFKGILHIIVEASDERVDAGVLIAVLADSEEEYEKIKSM
ncbi:MAG TPA: biotin/lipoyl-containing protein [Dehalococcoidales bacterium]|nr:biotin/lipoyl-containing protein [Dehalococcoidales bacterium]